MAKRWVCLLCAALVVTACGPAWAAGVMWGSGSPAWGGTGPVIFKLDTTAGKVVPGTVWAYSQWGWIMAVADSGLYLYVSHNTPSDPGQMRIAQVDRVTGVVVSDVAINLYLGTTYSQVNALEFACGTLYGVENSTWDTR